MFLHRCFTSGLAINSHIVGDEKSKRAAVIDPVRDISEYIHIAHERGVIITDILETHVHADFVSGALELKHALDNKPSIHCSGMGGKKWIPSYADKAVLDGDQILLGDLLLEAFHTPGHTPEHLTWKLYDLTRDKTAPWVLFTGDFLFVGDVGRPDLLGEETRKSLAHDLYESVFERLKPFPDFVEIFPAHGAGSLCGKALNSKPSSTLGYERQFNPALKSLPENEWSSQLMSHMPPAPPYFNHMKQVNVQGAPILGSNFLSEKALSAQKIYQLQTEGVQVLDVRNKESFAAAHIPGAINIPFSQMLSSYAGWILNYEDKLILVCDDHDNISEIIIAPLRVGFDHVLGYLEGGISNWERHGFPLQHLETLSAQELEQLLQSENKPTVIDVRSEGEWLSGHIEHALHYPLGPIHDDLFADIDPSSLVCLICGGGTRSGIMASCLQRKGFKKVANILGGMSAWNRLKLPTL